MRNLKALGLALFAVLALSATAGAVAQADQFKSETAGAAQLSGELELSSVSNFKTTAGTAQCFFGTFTGTMGSSPSTALTLTPSFSGCTCVGIGCLAEINGCKFILKLGAATTGSMDISCSAGKEITFSNNKCIIHVPPQTGLGTVTFSNTGFGATRELTVSLNLEKIKYKHTKNGTGVGVCTSGEGTTGTWTGSLMLTGLKDPGIEHVGLFVE